MASRSLAFCATRLLLIGLPVGVVLGASGCVDVCGVANCNQGNGGGAGDGGGGGTATSMMTSTSSMSVTTDIPSECDPLESGMPVAATCGIFVNADATSGDGSQGMPFATLTEALGNNPMNLPIYVCVATAPLDEDITLTASERLVGGVDCATWGPSAMKTAWTSPQNTIPLTLSQTTAAHVQSFAITAQAAEGFDAATLDGNDSIGVMADGATATLLQVDVTAGAGAAGGDGMDYTVQAAGAQSSPSEFNGSMGGGCGMLPGAEKMYSTCPAGGSSKGGQGGLGRSTVGSGGLPGEPDLMLGDPNGTAGVGDAGDPWTCGSGGNGESGHDGEPGDHGAGGTSDATLNALGLVGTSGSPGMPGSMGQGGGGGGGRRGGTDTDCPSANGPAGGGGGVGGCGGLGGGGGGQGGASIALASANSNLTLDTVTLTASTGGAGGTGGDRQGGGQGGTGGIGGGGHGCQGGSGGAGGRGGSGGGGAGGASVGLAFTGREPSIPDASVTISGTAATGGPGGNADINSNSGADGLTVKKQMF